jgi:hypothetical protein
MNGGKPPLLTIIALDVFCWYEATGVYGDFFEALGVINRE